MITFKYFIIVFRGMGTSNPVTQAPGTLSWVITGGSLSNHDVIVPKVDSSGLTGSSGIRFSNVTTMGDDFNVHVSYTFNATVVGPDPVMFRANNEAIG
jgi:hypothetical protein